MIAAFALAVPLLGRAHVLELRHTAWGAQDCRATISLPTLMHDGGATYVHTPDGAVPVTGWGSLDSLGELLGDLEAESPEVARAVREAGLLYVQIDARAPLGDDGSLEIEVSVGNMVGNQCIELSRRRMTIAYDKPVNAEAGDGRRYSLQLRTGSEHDVSRGLP